MKETLAHDVPQRVERKKRGSQANKIVQHFASKVYNRRIVCTAFQAIFLRGLERSPLTRIAAQNGNR